MSPDKPPICFCPIRFPLDRADLRFAHHLRYRELYDEKLYEEKEKIYVEP